MTHRSDPYLLRVGHAVDWPASATFSAVNLIYRSAQAQLLFFLRWLHGFFNAQHILFGSIRILNRVRDQWTICISYFFFYLFSRYELQNRAMGYVSSSFAKLKMVPFHLRTWFDLARLIKRVGRRLRGLTWLRQGGLSAGSLKHWRRVRVVFPLFLQQRLLFKKRYYFKCFGQPKTRRGRTKLHATFRRKRLFKSRRLFAWSGLLLNQYQYWVYKFRLTMMFERLLGLAWASRVFVRCWLSNVIDTFWRSVWFQLPNRLMLKVLRAKHFSRINNKRDLLQQHGPAALISVSRYWNIGLKTSALRAVASFTQTRGTMELERMMLLLETIYDSNTEGQTLFGRFAEVIQRYWSVPSEIAKTLHHFCLCLLYIGTQHREVSFLARWLQWQLEFLPKHGSISHKAFLAYFLQGLEVVLTLCGWLEGLRLEIRGKLNGASRSIKYLFAVGQSCPLSTLSLAFNYSFVEARTYTGLLSIRFWLV